MEKGVHIDHRNGRPAPGHNQALDRPELPGTDAWAQAPVPEARIRPIEPSVMTSARALRGWRLEFEATAAPATDPLMGWKGSRDSFRPIRIDFPSLGSAVEFAQLRGWRYRVEEPNLRRVRTHAGAPRRDIHAWPHYGRTAALRASRDRRSRPEPARPAEARLEADRIDAALMATFPASDSPCWTGTTLR